MTAPLMQAPYLREQRQFPNDDLKQLANQMDHAYIDIASKVNARVIGNYAVNIQTITGERFYFQGQPQKQQVLTQVYVFTSTASINHNIDFTTISYMLPSCYGSYTNGTIWTGLIFGSNVAIAGQISFYLTSSQIVFLVGAGAPALTSGIIVLKWISQF